MKKNPLTGEMEEFHSHKLQDDLPEEEAEEAETGLYDPTSQRYKAVLREKLVAQRASRYLHLPGRWFEWLILTLLAGAAALWGEGCPPGRVRDFVFDLEPRPGGRRGGLAPCA